jgi:hypothetical protein
MEYRNLADVVSEKLGAIAAIISSVERSTDVADLRHLTNHLIGALSLFRRNPGIEAAADDLYGAAAAIVVERRGKVQPTSRKLRLLNEAHLRFRGRLEAAAERLGPYEHLMVPIILTKQAA